MFLIEEQKLVLLFTNFINSFSASDGQSLRVYQAVIDARTLLAEMNQGNPKQNIMESSLMSMSSQGT